jgi:hypothetical protein
MPLLVFGLGHDSNSTCGVTVFLEEDPEWYKVVRTWLDRADLLLDSNRRVSSCLPLPVPVPGAKPLQVRGNAACPLALHELPPEVYEHERDMLMLDAPKGVIRVGYRDGHKYCQKFQKLQPESTELSVVVFNSSKPNDLVFLFFLHLKSKAQLCYIYMSLDLFMPPSAHADASH